VSCNIVHYLVISYGKLWYFRLDIRTQRGTRKIRQVENSWGGLWWWRREKRSGGGGEKEPVVLAVGWRRRTTRISQLFWCILYIILCLFAGGERIGNKW